MNEKIQQLVQTAASEISESIAAMLQNFQTESITAADTLARNAIRDIQEIVKNNNILNDDKMDSINTILLKYNLDARGVHNF